MGKSMFLPGEVAVGGLPTIYQVWVPPGGGPRPVVLFLHGAGEAGNDGVRPTTVGIGPAIVRDPERFPAIVVFPQASRGYGWRDFNLDAAFAALDDVMQTYEVDAARVVVTGISMGGYGTWLALATQPNRFAAAAPVCGGVDRLGAEAVSQRIAHVPLWVFHGADDDVIPAEQSRVMVAALEAAGAEVRYSEYPGVRHNSWDRAYAEPELMPWLMSHRRKQE